MTSKMSQYDAALLQLRRFILSGGPGAGLRLTETALALRVGLSRTPLRQAIYRLVDEGLLQQHPSGGCKVASFSRQDVNDAIELRGVIEGMAARLEVS